jgi:glycine cleavage system H protein
MGENLALVRNCVLLRNLYYDIPNHIWLRQEPNDCLTLGFTDVAQTTAGKILIISYRPVGRHYRKGKALAVVESAKWLGPLRTPVAGTLVAVNQTLPKDVGWINRSPYRKGWVARVAPDDPTDIQQYLTGEAALAAYEAFMETHHLDDCIHCEGYELP